MRCSKAVILVAGLVLALPSLYTAPARAADCGTAEKVTIAEMTWLSASINAHVVERILSQGYRCETELVPGDTVPTATSMLTKSKPMVAPELWIQSAPNIWKKIQDKGNVYQASNIFDPGGIEGWFIPDYLAEEKPGLRQVTDLPDHAELFVESGTSGKARLYGCPPGWGCEKSTNNLFRALELSEKGFESTPFSPGSGANLKAAIARKVARKEPVVAYYWGPTAVIGRYNLVKLTVPAEFDQEKWDCLLDSNCANPQLVPWPTHPVAVAVVTELRQQAPDVTAFLERMRMRNADINKVLAWTDQSSAEPEAGAEYFLKNFEDVWTEWVPGDVAERVRSSL